MSEYKPGDVVAVKQGRIEEVNEYGQVTVETHRLHVLRPEHLAALEALEEADVQRELAECAHTDALGLGLAPKVIAQADAALQAAIQVQESALAASLATREENR
jgi:hypothetical protein